MDMAQAIMEMFVPHTDSFAGPIPAKGESYDATAGRCTRRPVVDLHYGALTVAAPVLHDVPVIWPGGSGGTVTCPLAAGDTVYLVPAGWDIDGWLAGGEGATTPRRFDLSDCLAIPGVAISGRDPDAVATDGPVLRGTHVYLGGSSATDFVALASLVLAELVKISGAITSLADLMATHTHVVQDKSGTTIGTAIASNTTGVVYTPTDPGSTVVRSK